MKNGSFSDIEKVTRACPGTKKKNLEQKIEVKEN
jgi:hypothetical protein